MSFKVMIEKRALKEICKLPRKQQKRILIKVNKVLSINPYPENDNPKRLKPTKRAVYRLRIGKYRALYKIMKDNILIFDIDHRKDIYK